MNKVETPLSERYLVTCARCLYVRQMFGTASEVRAEAERMGWVFTLEDMDTQHHSLIEGIFIRAQNQRERAYCPHCKALYKETT